MLSLAFHSKVPKKCILKNIIMGVNHLQTQWLAKAVSNCGLFFVLGGIVSVDFFFLTLIYF